jgi:hypothetical protein
MGTDRFATRMYEIIADLEAAPDLLSLPKRQAENNSPKSNRQLVSPH